MSASTTIAGNTTTQPFVRPSALATTLRDSCLLLRPKGFAIMFIFALNGYALGAPARDGKTLALDMAILFFGWAVLLASGTNQFNSAFDRDTGAITMLDHPPAPPRGLAAIGLVAMIAGALLFAIRSWAAAKFGLVLAAAGVIYSYGFGLRRVKEIPVLDIVWNGLGYGLGAMAMGYLLTGAPLREEFWWVGFGFSISFAATAVVAQIPQQGQADFESRTFTALVGPRRAWLFCASFYATGGIVAVVPWLRRMPGESLLVDGLVVFFLTMLLTCARMCVRFAETPTTNSRQRTNRLAILLVGRIAFVILAWIGTRPPSF